MTCQPPSGLAEIAAAAPGHGRAVRQMFIDHLDDGQPDATADVAETILAAADTSDDA